MKTVADLFANSHAVLGKTGQADRHFVHVERLPADAPDGSATWVKSVEPGQLQNEYWVAREKNLLLLLKKLPQVARLRKDDDNSDSTFHTVRTRDAGIPLETWLKLKPQHIASGRTLEHPFAQVGAFLRLARGILTALKAIHREGVVHANLDATNLCLPYQPSPFDFETGIRPDYPGISLIDFMFAVSSTLRLYRPLAIKPLAPPSYHSSQLRQALEADQAAQRADAIQNIDYSVDLYALGHLLEDIFQRGLIYPGNMQSQMEMTIYNLIHELLGFDDGVPDQISERYGGTLPHDVYIKRIDNMLALDPQHTSEDQDLLLLDPVQLLDEEPEAEGADQPSTEPHQPAPDHKDPAGDQLLMTASPAPVETANEAPAAKGQGTRSYLEVNRWMVVAALVLTQVTNFIYHEGDRMHLDIALSILLLLGLAGGALAAMLLFLPRKYLFQYVEGTDDATAYAGMSLFSTERPAVIPDDEYIQLSPVAVVTMLFALQVCSVLYEHGDSMGLDVASSIITTLLIAFGISAGKIGYDRYMTPKPRKRVVVDEDEAEATASAPQPSSEAPLAAVPVMAAAAPAMAAVVEAESTPVAELLETVTEAVDAPVATESFPVAAEVSPVVTAEPETPESAPEDQAEPVVVLSAVADDLPVVAEAPAEDSPVATYAPEGTPVAAMTGATPVAPAATGSLAALTGYEDPVAADGAALAAKEPPKHLELDNRIVIVVVLLLLLLFFWTSMPKREAPAPAPVPAGPAPEINEAPVVDMGLPEVPPAVAETPAQAPVDDSMLNTVSSAPATPRAAAAPRPAKAKPAKTASTPAETAESTTETVAPAEAAPETTTEAAPSEAAKTPAAVAAKPAETPAEAPKPAKPLGNSLAEAQNIMGWHYFKGITVSKDLPEALNWFRKSALMGNASGQFNLGMMYANGYGTARDYQAAAHWFKMAADQGKANAQLNLGLMYLAGRGVEQNTKEGLRLLQLAADQGDKNAQANLDAIARGNKPLPETPAP